MGSGTKLLTIPEAISSSDVLRFAPVALSRTASGAGKFKVCFCDSGLLLSDVPRRLGVLGVADAAVDHDLACVGLTAYVLVGIREHVRDQQLHLRQPWR